MTIRMFGAAAALIVLSGTAAAQEPAQQASAKPVKEKKVCRSIIPTGTLMAKRFCLTKKEWTEFGSQNDRHNDMFRDNKNKSLNREAQGF